MYYICDLHTHITASDGQHAPSKLVSGPRRGGFRYLAVTDHDTMDGLEEAMQAGEKLVVRVIPGVKLSAREYPTFHILGYGFKLGASPLQSYVAR